MRLEGTASAISWPTTRCWVVLWTSTSAASADTVTVCSTDPTASSAFTVAMNEPDNSSPSRRNVLKPFSVKVITYEPGRKSTMRYWPVPSVTDVRDRSMSAGLDASTVTPGSTAPDASRTTPVMEACAKSAAGTIRTSSTGEKAGLHVSAHQDLPVWGYGLIVLPSANVTSNTSQ